MTDLDPKALAAAVHAWIDADPLTRYFQSADETALQAAIRAYLEALPSHGPYCPACAHAAG